MNRTESDYWYVVLCVDEWAKKEARIAPLSRAIQCAYGCESRKPKCPTREVTVDRRVYPGDIVAFIDFTWTLLSDRSDDDYEEE